MRVLPEPKIETFDVDPTFGLSLAEVRLRQKEGQVNKTKKVVSKSYPKILFDNICNPFNALLLVVMGVMIYGQLSFTNFVFAFVLGLNILIGVYQDVHARLLLERLKVVSDTKCRVIRDGKEMDVAPEELVLSDILVLKQGDQIQADCIIRSGTVHSDESMLTGESVPVKKIPGDTLFSGSFVRSGACFAEISAVGKRSYAEKLRRSASKFSRPKSEIAQSVWNITVTCSLIALGFGIAYTVVFFLRDADPVGALFPMTPRGTDFIQGLSGAMIAMLPTGMFLLTSVALTTGVISLAKKHMLVQELYCIEMLARVDVLCMDKTGTLTDGDMSVYEVEAYNGHLSAEVGYGVSAILRGTKDENLTAKALAKKFGRSFPKFIEEVLPFDGEKKYSAVSGEDFGTYCMGAYGFVPAKPDPNIAAKIEESQQKGYRCLVLAHSEKTINDGVLPKNLEFCGLLVLSDNVKKTAKDSIAWFLSSGVDVRVISGDSPIMVAEIAKQCGIEGADAYIDMSTLEDGAIPVIAAKCKVFGRTSPEQKEKIVEALKAMGHKVAMTGDGVNDILALKVADCSIAMGNGSSAAKSVAHLVCANSDFDALPDVVAQGRRVINNLQRSCSLFLNKTLFAMVVSTFFLITSMFGGPAYPFSASNMLVWEIFAIGLPSFFLALQPSSERLEGAMLRNIFIKVFPCAMGEVVSVMVPLLLYYVMPSSLFALSSDPQEIYAVAISMGIIGFSFVSYLALYRICRPMNKYRAIVFAVSLALGIAVFLADFFVRPDGSHGFILHFRWGGFAWSFPLFLLGSLALATLTYFLLRYFIEIRPKRRNES